MPSSLVHVAVAELLAIRVENLRLLPRVPRAYRVAPAGEGDVEQLEELFGDPAKVRELLAAGDTCLTASSDDRIEAAEWIRWGPSSYRRDEGRLGTVFEIPAGQAWLHNGMNRSQGALGPWGILMGRLRSYVESAGVEVLVLQVDANADYSLRCHRSLGFRQVGRLVCCRLLGTPFAARREVGGRWRSVGKRAVDVGRLM